MDGRETPLEFLHFVRCWDLFNDCVIREFQQIDAALLRDGKSLAYAQDDDSQTSKGGCHEYLLRNT